MDTTGRAANQTAAGRVCSAGIYLKVLILLLALAALLACNRHVSVARSNTGHPLPFALARLSTPEEQPCSDKWLSCSAAVPRRLTLPTTVGQPPGVRFLNETASELWTTNSSFPLNSPRSVRGDATGIQAVLRKAREGKCITLGIVGSSLCASGRPKKFFHYFLVDLLNREIPCSVGGNNHTLWDECHPGVPSLVHVYSTVEYIKRHPNTDLVMFDFALTDTRFHSDEKMTLHWQLEFMEREWRKAGAARLYVYGSFGIDQMGPGEIRASSSELVERSFLQLYQVPAISLAQMLLPQFWTHFLDSSSPVYIMDMWMDSGGHLYPYGQAVVAEMIFRELLVIENETSPDLPFRYPLEPVLISPEYYGELLAGIAVDDFFTREWKRTRWPNWISPGWEITDEHRGKWGLVATTAGSMVIDQLDEAAVGNLRLTTLHSYENMGRFAVTFHGCWSRGSSDIQTVERDTLWDNHASESVVTEIPIPEACSRYVLEILDTPPRAINKVKLIRISQVRSRKVQQPAASFRSSPSSSGSSWTQGLSAGMRIANEPINKTTVVEKTYRFVSNTTMQLPPGLDISGGTLVVGEGWVMRGSHKAWAVFRLTEHTAGVRISAKMGGAMMAVTLHGCGSAKVYKLDTRDFTPGVAEVELDAANCKLMMLDMLRYEDRTDAFVTLREVTLLAPRKT